jgi:exopolyphosphatase/guanosine-5'-triphosphate,3'-diphosphate pyrophosphatase
MSSRERQQPGQSSCESFFAALDIGSHTTRMLIARKEGTVLEPVLSERRVTRLARGFLGHDQIARKAQLDTISALREYLVILEKYKVSGIACGATGVLRRAKNSGAVLDRIASETGIECRVLSEEAESLLSAKGIVSVLSGPVKYLLAFDVGGGSTEFVLGLEEVSTASRPIGAAILTDAYLEADPPGAAALNQARLSARKEISSAKEQLYENLEKTGRINISSLLKPVGTAGTVTTLAAMYLKMERYVPYRVNGLVLTADWLGRTIESLAELPLSKRRLIAGLEPGREDIILGGAVLVSEILSCFAFDSFVVSDAGLLEGLLIDLVEKRRAPNGGEAAGLGTGLTWRFKNG